MSGRLRVGLILSMTSVPVLAGPSVAFEGCNFVVKL